MPDDDGPLFKWRPPAPPDPPALPTPAAWRDARDKAMAKVENNAGPTFAQQAYDFIIAHLRQHGAQSGEAISMACKSAGIVPHDDRAFGPVYLRLVKDKLIEKCGTVIRRRGHGTSGGNVWRLR